MGRLRLRTAFVVLTLVGIGLGWHVNRPRLVLEGMCPVTVWEEGMFVPGQPGLAVTFMGCRYWFAGPQERDAFLAQPWRYGMRIIRKILAAVLIMTAIAAASAAVPGLIHNVAHACPGGARDC